MDTMQGEEVHYVGFWLRVLAALIDSILITCLTVPVVLLFFNIATESQAVGFIIQWVLPAAATIVFWVYKSATPGKMLIKAEIVDAATLGKPTTGQFIGRYLGYYVSSIPLFLGILWVAFDKRKQGWHDKLAGTVVIRTGSRSPQA